MTEDWKKYRGIQITRDLLPETTPDGRPKWIYYAIIPGAPVPNLVSRSQAGIKAQIGRSLNGLPPCDCSICVFNVPQTPIAPEHCSKGALLYPVTGLACTWFEVRR